MTAGLTLKQALKALAADDAGWVAADSATAPASRVYVPAEHRRSACTPSRRRTWQRRRRRLIYTVDELALPQDSPTAVRPALGDSRSRRIACGRTSPTSTTSPVFDGNNNGAAKDYEVCVSDDPNDFGAFCGLGHVEERRLHAAHQADPPRTDGTSSLSSRPIIPDRTRLRGKMNVELLPTAVEETRSLPRRSRQWTMMPIHTPSRTSRESPRSTAAVLAPRPVVNVGDEDVTVTVTAEPADGYRFPDGGRPQSLARIDVHQEGWREASGPKSTRTSCTPRSPRLRRSTVPPIRTSRSRCLMTSRRSVRSMTMTR